MTTVPSRRILSPTVLLYSFVVITQFGFCLYIGGEREPPPGYMLLNYAAQLWIMGWWLRDDSRKRGIAWVYDMGFFLSIAWPIVLPYYLLKTRGAKGLIVIIGFIGAYLVASFAGVVVGTVFKLALLPYS